MNGRHNAIAAGYKTGLFNNRGLVTHRKVHDILILSRMACGCFVSFNTLGCQTIDVNSLEPLQEEVNLSYESLPET